MITQREPNDRVLETHAGPVLIRADRYYSINIIRPYFGGDDTIEIRYEITKESDFNRHGFYRRDDAVL